MQSVIDFFHSDAGKVLCACLILVIEYWLGKTDKVKEGSLLELALSGLKKLLGKNVPPAPPELPKA